MGHKQIACFVGSFQISESKNFASRRKSFHNSRQLMDGIFMPEKVSICYFIK